MPVAYLVTPPQEVKQGCFIVEAARFEIGDFRLTGTQTEGRGDQIETVFEFTDSAGTLYRCSPWFKQSGTTIKCLMNASKRKRITPKLLIPFAHPGTRVRQVR